MKEIIFKERLNENEINQYCKNNNYTLIMVSYKDNNTLLKVVVWTTI